VLAAYAVFIGGAWFGIYYPALRLLSVAAAAAVLGAWSVLAARDPAWRPRSALLPAILACLASLAISTAFSRRPGISIEYLAYAVMLVALYLFLVQLMARSFFRGRFVVLAGALFLAIVVAYFGFSAVHWATWLQTLGRLTIPPLRPEFESLTFGNPSTVLTMVALLAIPLVAGASWTTRRGLAVVVLVLAVVAAVAVVSGSRSGWLALAIAGTLAVAAGIARRDVRSAFRGAVVQRSTAGRAVLAGLAVVVVVVGIALGPAVLKRVTAGGEANRLAFVRIALDLFAESPAVGTGPGTWVIQRPAYTAALEPDEYIPHAHNVYAQTLAEQGVIGAVAGVVLVVFVLRLLIGAVRDPDPVRRRWGWATTIGLVYFAAHQALDFYPNFPSILFGAAIPVAWLDATSATTAATGAAPARIRAWGRAAPSVATSALIALALAIAFLGWQELPALTANRAVDLANRGDWAAADAPAREAAAQDPRISSYLFTAGLTAAHAGDHEASAAYFELVTQTDDVPEAWLNLAAEQAELGDDAGAAASLQRALRIGYQRPAVAIAAGDLAMRIGQPGLAGQFLTHAAIVAPSILGDPWWLQTAARTEVRDSVAEGAAGFGPGVEWEVALMTGDVARARQVAATPGLDPSTVDFVDAWAGDEAAYQRLIDRCAADPLNISVLFWCARIEGHRGNVARANDYRYLANAQVGGTYRSGAELRVATEPMVGRSLEGNPAIFWGTYTYRRYTPWDVLVPSLVHLTLE